MTQRFRLILATVAFSLFALPSFASAAPLTSAQASAIVGLLAAFGADQAVILRVEQALGILPGAGTGSPDASVPVASAHVPVTGSLYRSSNLGFDYSYNAPLFPPDSFGFGIVGVTGGKSFTQNPRITQEFNWAKFGSGAPPTLYVNANAPYGSTVAGHVSSPKDCPTTTVGTTTDPTACAGYNYGYQAAESAYAYASGTGIHSSVWWLDIEEANSWSPDTSVNDQVIQGMIDYLNSKGVRVGIYSVPYMWNDIAGASFTPSQTINGQSVSIPNWFPIGIANQVTATNACNTKGGFIPGSQVWLIQYVANSTAVDQNIAC